MLNGRDEAGNSPVTVTFGVAIFLAFLLLATQTVLHLYATSTATSILHDEARRVAAAGDSYSCVSAVSSISSRLSGWGGDLIVECSGDTDGSAQVTLAARGTSPVRLVSGLSSAVGINTFNRTVTVTREQFRQ